MHPTPFTRPRLLLALLLLILTMGTFGQVLHHRFLEYDDDLYVTGNHEVHHGLSAGGVAWAFASTNGANWHPVTMLSHMADVELFGLNPAWHHMTSLLIHAANTLLLFLVLARMTGKTWRSAVVAALFAVHPLHVESVAWVAARKDLLSLFFVLLALGAYLRYVSRPSPVRYLAVALFFAFGLMSKPVVVTFPLLLLLLDFWPLGRVVQPGDGGGARVPAGGGGTMRPLLLEKLPLLLLSAVMSVVTYVVQSRSGAVGSLAGYPPLSRLGNALVAYASYLRKTILPFPLSPYYPHPGGNLSLWTAVGAALLLGMLTAAALKQLRRRPWLPVGWFWFAGALVPMIGIVQVGDQAMADRYTYIPLIGLFVAAVWGAAELAGRRRRPGRRAFAAAGVAVLLLLASLSWRQSAVWRDNASLFGHAVAVDPGNWFARVNLGSALEGDGKRSEAIAQYREAIRLRKDYPLAHYNLGVSLYYLGEIGEAVACFRTAVALKPEYAEAHNNLGSALFASGRTEEAVEQYGIALRLNPMYADAEDNLGLALESLGREEDAATHYAHVLAIRPGDPLARQHFEMIRSHHRGHGA